MAKVNFSNILSDSVFAVREYSTLVINTFKDKGVKYFQLPLVVAIAVCVFSYTFLKKPASESLRRDLRQIDSVKAQIQHVGSFTPNKLKVEKFESRLPPFGEKGEWLRKQLIDICRAQGVTQQSASPQSDALVGDYIVTDMSFVVRLSFEQLGELVAKIENNPQLLRITSLTVTRDQAVLNVVTATFKVATVFVPPLTASGEAPKP